MSHGGNQNSGVIMKSGDWSTTVAMGGHNLDITYDNTNPKNFRNAHGSFRVDSTRMYLPLITKRGYTKDQFMSSLTYYMHRPDDFDDIFKQVSAKLDREMDLAESAANQEYLDMEDRGIEEVEEAPVVEEGKEPHIEKEERQKSLAADTVASEKPAAPEKPVKKERQSKRKKISQKDLKRLEEELK